MKKMIGSMMLAGLLFTGAACGSDSKADTPSGGSDTTAAESQTGGGESSNADVADYCKQAEELGAELKGVMADPSKGDVAAITKQAQELVAAAAELSSANADDVDEITACSNKITASLGG